LAGARRRADPILVDRPDFPAPIETLTVGRIWDAVEVREYAAKRRERNEGGAG
jgi:hypothetical protein